MTLTAPDLRCSGRLALPGLRLRLSAQDGLPPVLEPLAASRALGRQSARDGLFLYVHVPFCEMRCGFCNLFTQARPRRT